MKRISSIASIISSQPQTRFTGSKLHTILVPNSNSYDSQFASSWFIDNGGLDPNGRPVGPADQRAQIRTFNIAPTWTRVISSSAVFTLGAFVRHDQFNYYPSHDPFADLSPLQLETVAQDRRLTNAGVRSDISYVKGIHNFKAGVTYQQTPLIEKFNVGIVDPTFLGSLSDANGNPSSGWERQSYRRAMH